MFFSKQLLVGAVGSLHADFKYIFDDVQYKLNSINLQLGVQFKLNIGLEPRSHEFDQDIQTSRVKQS